ncbi:MAG TPA: hypothetical protein ENI64_07540 [Gammaproteobacteria bacterium]|nr:hypothetical protein [Gammaproteobacteria bacterium]
MPVSILAGPVLRRTENNRICIWLVTNQKADVKGYVYQDADLTNVIGREEAARNGAPDSIKLGDRLHVYLIQLRPTQADKFPLDKVLQYDLTIGGKTLAEHGLIGGSKGINYPGHKLPSLIIPNVLKHVLYGSCRKPHTEAARDSYGIYDQLATGDAVVAKKAKNKNVRPSHLILTGDQIYADDVAGPLLASLVTDGRKLTGWDESLPLKSSRKTRTINAADIPLYGRKNILDNEVAGITSSNGENHLMTFGEYAAMYIAVWSGNEIDLPPTGSIEDSLSADVYTIDDSDLEDNFGTIYSSIYDNELVRLIPFNRTLPKVRRLMANISTLMICDDHDVTDDWNIRKKWERKINNNPLGRRLLCNALAAYWAFQGWGNSPDSFDGPFMNMISEHLNNKKIRGVTAKKYEDTLLETHWLYSVPTNPPIISLDTRTQRQTDNQRNPARLVGTQGLKDLKKHFNKYIRPQYDSTIRKIPAIIVSAAPVFGFKAIEFAQRKVFGTGLASVESLDYESWIANKKGYNKFVSTLNNDLKLSWAVFLSGDVHYSFVKKYKKGKRANKGTEKLLFDAYQLTSSPIMNAPSVKYLFRKVTDEKHAEHARKNNYLLPVLPYNSKKYVIDENNIGMISFVDGKPAKTIFYYTNKKKILKNYTYNLTAPV